MRKENEERKMQKSNVDSEMQTLKAELEKKSENIKV